MVRGATIRVNLDKNMSRAQITIPLDISDVRVLQTALGEREELILTIESTKDGTRCCKCGRWIRKLHGRDDWVTIRHLPAFGRPTYLRYRPKRYQCQACEGCPITTQEMEWHEANSPQSFAYDNHVLLQLVHSTVEDVSHKEGLSYERVAGAVERRIDSRVDWKQRFCGGLQQHGQGSQAALLWHFPPTASTICFSAFSWICMAIACSQPPPYMAESR